MIIFSNFLRFPQNKGRGGDVCVHELWGLIEPDPDIADFNGNDVVDWGDVVKLAYYYWELIPEL